LLILFHSIPDADPNKSLHDVGEEGLLVVIRPSLPQRRIIKDRFKTLQDSENMVDDLYGFIEDEEGMAIVYLFLYVNVSRTTIRQLEIRCRR
jgi:hypothetical protein